MSHISAVEYAAEMRRLEGIRNEALGHRDRSAIREILLQVLLLNRAYWGHDLRSSRAGGPA